MTCPKVCYPTKKVAKKFMKLYNKTAKLGLTDVYFCTICSMRHTTSLDKEKNREYNSRKGQ